MKDLRHIRTDRTMSRQEFLDVCSWKSPRAQKHARRNSAAAIRKTIMRVFSTRDEKERMRLLLSLHGVSIPTASAILTMIHPRRYGVIDIRVWQLLSQLKAVSGKPGGQNFTTRDWIDYLDVLRREAGRSHTSVRRLELTLFDVHRAYQSGTLYRAANMKKGRTSSQRWQR
jgi:hypothetical protein